MHNMHDKCINGKVSQMKLVARVKSQSNQTMLYEIRMAEDGALSCSCPSFAYRRQCKHATEFRLKKPDVIAKARRENSLKYGGTYDRDHNLQPGETQRSGLSKPCTQEGGSHLYVYLNSNGPRCWHCKQPKP